MTRRDIILAAVSDAVIDLVYYDRKEDEEMPMDSIEEAVAAGELTVSDIVSEFERHLREHIVEPTTTQGEP